MKATKSNSKMTVKKTKHTRASPKHNAVLKNVVSKKKIEKQTQVKKNGKKLLIAQEVKFARLLANNDKRVRDKVLKNLKKWLTVRSQSSFAFTEEDFLRLWKGLFYCMWMSDKPLVQEDLAESLSKLVHCFNSMEPALLYTKCTLRSLATEWFGIDHFRIDKFQMLVRKIIRQTFVMCKNQSWNKQWVVGAAKIIEEILLDPKTCLGLSLHITELYMEELAKISEGHISTDRTTEFIRPFIIHLVSMGDLRQIKHVIKNIFRYLILQSDVGMDYTEKFNAWRNAGFPCQSIDEMQKMEVSDDEAENENGQDEDENDESEAQDKPLDPRAGRVDVEIPQLPFDAAGIAGVLKENKFHKSSTTVTRKAVTRLINDFTKLHKGDMPFGIKEIPVADATRFNPQEAAEDLLSFDNNLYHDSAKRRRRINSDSVEDSEDEDQNSPSSDDEDEDQVSLSSDDEDEVENSQSFEDDDDVSISKAKSKKGNKQKKIFLKKELKKLNVSEPLSNQKVKKSSKKFNSFTESTVESKTDIASPAELSGSLNWSVDESSSTSSTPRKVLSAKKTKGAKKALLTPVLTRLEEQKKVPTTGSAKKRVKIMEQKNMEQIPSEYIRQLLSSPGIPFDANRKPKASALKPSPLPSPMNPFYKNKSKNKWQ